MHLDCTRGTGMSVMLRTNLQGPMTDINKLFFCAYINSENFVSFRMAACLSSMAVDRSSVHTEACS